MLMFFYVDFTIDYDWELLPIIKKGECDVLCTRFLVTTCYHQLLEKCLEVAKSDKDIAWEGDFAQGPCLIPLPNTQSFGISFGFMWKQSNNGIIFVASPFELPWMNSEAGGPPTLIDLQDAP